MKALWKIFKTVNTSDEFKSTIKVCLYRKSSTRPHAGREGYAGRPEVCRTPTTSRPRQSCLLYSPIEGSRAHVMSLLLCFVFVSDSNKLTNWSRGLNVFIVKIRLEFVFNRCEERRSAFDSLLGNAADCTKQGEISDKYICRLWTCS